MSGQQTDEDLIEVYFRESAEFSPRQYRTETYERMLAAFQKLRAERDELADAVEELSQQDRKD